LLERYSGIDFLDQFYSSILFYDYTKNVNHISRYRNTSYKITFSRSETNEAEAKKVLKMGGNVAVVFQDQLPETWNGYQVINGDETDLRYFDPVNVVVGLKAKGDAKKDFSGFVVS
jgi:transposase